MESSNVLCDLGLIDQPDVWTAKGAQCRYLSNKEGALFDMKITGDNEVRLPIGLKYDFHLLIQATPFSLIFQAKKSKVNLPETSRV